MKDVKSKRNSNVELLRIFSILLIVASHFAQHSGLISLSGKNKWLINIFLSLGQIGVAFFFLITGYFFSKFEGKSRKEQILKILYPVWFYSVLVLLFCLFRDRAFLGSFFNFMRLFFPFTTNSYWFIGTYVGIVLISPFLLKMLNSLNNSQIKELLCLMFIFSSISPLLNFFLSSNYVSIFTITYPLFYIFYGYAVSRMSIGFSKMTLPSLFFGILLLCSGPFIVELLKRGYTNVPSNLYQGLDSLPCVLITTSLFTALTKKIFFNLIVNKVASLVFGVYIIHENIYIREKIWLLFNPQNHINNTFLDFIVFSLRSILFVFIVCLGAEFIRATLIHIARKKFKLFMRTVKKVDIDFSIPSE